MTSLDPYFIPELEKETSRYWDKNRDREFNNLQEYLSFEPVQEEIEKLGITNEQYINQYIK